MQRSLKLTNKEVCSLFDIILILGSERKFLRLNSLEEDYNTILKKVEILDSKVHKEERTAQQIKNWANRKTKDKK